MKNTLQLIFVAVIAVASVWFISNAQDNSSTTKKFISIIGLVTTKDGNSLTMDNAQGSDRAQPANYSMDATGAKVETKSYDALSYSDLNVGDQIIAQGYITGSDISIKRIILISASQIQIPKVVETASTTSEISTTTSDTSTVSETPASTPKTTPTTTPEVSTSTPDLTPITTPEISTSTDDTASTTPTTTPDLTSTTTNETATDTPVQ